MTSIKKLRDITQKGKVMGRERPWLYKTLQRGPSIYITALLLKTRLSPNTVSAISIFVGIAGSVVLVFPATYWLFAGIILCYLNILLDKVDGELARYKQNFSLRGVFLDEINHLVVPALFFVGMMLHIVLFTDLGAVTTLIAIVAGIFGALSMSFIRTGWSLAPQIFAKKYLKHPELFPLPDKSNDTVAKIKNRHSFVAHVLGFVHQFQEFFMILVVFLIATIVEITTVN